ncbi:hypothetical protein D3C78_1532360 [compost metagenome]
MAVGFAVARLRLAFRQGLAVLGKADAGQLAQRQAPFAARRTVIQFVHPAGHAALLLAGGVGLFDQPADVLRQAEAATLLPGLQTATQYVGAVNMSAAGKGGIGCFNGLGQNWRQQPGFTARANGSRCFVMSP